MLRPDICVYHANCLDGFGSAYAVWKKYGNDVVYIPMHYGEDFWTTMGMAGGHGAQFRICFVDFSLPRAAMMEIYERGHEVVVIDHHQTAEAALKDMPFETVFDIGHSGAWLTWEYFHAETQVPSLIAFIQDRDLWAWQLPYSKEVSMYLWASEQSFTKFDQLRRLFEDPEAFRREVVCGGSAILAYAEKQTEIMAQRYTLHTIGGREMPVVNATCLFSEVGDWLCQHGHEAAAYWFQRGNVYQWGLRSRGGVDVSVIAQQYGGGGHKSAAGFVRTAAEHQALLG